MKRIWEIIFAIALILHLVSIQLGVVELQQVTKTMLMPLLALQLATATKGNGAALKKPLLLALFFSWCGDIVLLMQDRSEIFFMAGLFCFLLAHIFYIIFFAGLKRTHQIKWINGLMIIPIIYAASLVGWLLPKLGSLLIPVMVYALVITAMLFLALHMVRLPIKPAKSLLIAGAISFVLSDSILAINKFSLPFEWAGFLIMLTYGLAQQYLVWGAIEYIRRSKE